VPSSGALEKFAESRNLRFRGSGSLPQHGNLLTRGGHAEITDSEGHSETHTQRFTIVVTSVPQSIGFMPSLGFRRPESEMSGIGDSLEQVERVDLGDDARLKHARSCSPSPDPGSRWPRSRAS